MLIDKVYKSKNKSYEEIIHSAYNMRSVISFIKPVNYLILRKRPELLRNIDYVFCDGILASKWFSLLLKTKIIRASFDFTSLAAPFFKYCIDNNKKVYFVGSKEAEISSFVALIHKEYPLLEISGYQNGYFTDSDMKGIFKEMEKSNTDVLVCGMGCSRQEEFIVAASKEMPQTNLFITCGGFFHQTQESKNYYPRLINKFHLRMPYRFFKEKHTRGRLPSYPLFLYHSLIDLLKEKFK